MQGVVRDRAGAEVGEGFGDHSPLKGFAYWACLRVKKQKNDDGFQFVRV